MNQSLQRGTRATKLFLAAGALFLPCALAQAHPLPGEHTSFASGFSHPLHGLDHILAMVAVGLWAAQQGGRAMWAIPAAFVAFMAVGGALGMAGVHIPHVESGIVASVLILGLLIAFAARLPLWAGALLTGLFAVFHGHAHGVELPAAASEFAYAIGFVAATALLHGCGVGLGRLARERAAFPAVRFAGAAIVVAGVCLTLY
jgi:urease accessory protein